MLISADTTILLVVCLYLFGMLAAGLVFRKHNRSAGEYYLGGRRLPYWVIAFSMNATGESAWLLLGLSGMAYVVGIHAFLIVVGETIGIALSWRLLARRLNRAGRLHDAVTLPDVLSAELNDRRHWLRGASAAIILIMASVYVAAQFLATGKAFETFLGWPYATGVLVGGVVTVTYTSIGGFKAVAYTDTIQAFFMLFAVLAVPIVGLFAVGGMAELIRLLCAADPALLSPILFSPTMLGGIIGIASALAVGLPFLGVPQLLVRYLAIRDEGEIGKASCISVVVVFLFGAGAVATGLVARALFPALDDPEMAMPLLSQSLFPPLLTGVLTVAVLSAVMSTVSSLLNLTSSTVVRDFYQQCLRPDLPDIAVGRIGIWVTVIVGVVGCMIALNQQGLIFNLVLFAWAGLGAAFGPVVLCLLWWPRTTRQGAIAGIVAGFGTTVVWITGFKEEFFNLYEMIPGFFTGLVVTVIVSLCTKREVLRQS